MAEKKKSMSGQDLGPIIAANLKRLIDQNNTTQKQLADDLHISAAAMSDYCKGRRLPSVDFVVALKDLYDISLDDFLTKSINPSCTPISAKESIFDNNMMTTYKKYCGTYFVYYFDTSKYKGRDNLSPKDSLLYGIIILYENPSSLEIPEFSSAAILGIESREDCLHIKKEIDKMGDPAKIMEYIDKNYRETAYYGDFELTHDHAFFSINHANMDRALIIVHRVDNNKPNYTGGIGTINSISKGREHMPVIQYIGLSRYPLDMSIEEIHHCLLLNYPAFKAEDETEEMIELFKTLFIEDENNKQHFSEYQKTVFVRSTLERYINKSLERNMFRYGKISGRDDDEWYHAIKAASLKYPI